MKWDKFDIRKFSDSEFEKWYSMMNISKQERVDRFRFDEDKKRTVAGEMLARKMIAEQCNVLPETISFGVSQSGKPYAEGINIHFNISHSGDLVVCAIADSPVGIDIEKIRQIDYSILKQVCSNEELNRLASCGERSPEGTKVLRKFFEKWTEREASYKVGTKKYSISHPETDKGYILCIAQSK